jgi:hypothetical protein
MAIIISAHARLVVDAWSDASLKARLLADTLSPFASWTMDHFTSEPE